MQRAIVIYASLANSLTAPETIRSTLCNLRIVASLFLWIHRVGELDFSLRRLAGKYIVASDELGAQRRFFWSLLIAEHLCICCLIAQRFCVEFSLAGRTLSVV